MSAHTPGPLRTGLPGALYALEVIRDMLAGQGLEQQAQAVAAQALARLTPEMAAQANDYAPVTELTDYPRNGSEQP